MKPKPRPDPGKCSRCHKNPVTRPARICASCIKAPKKRRTSRATSRPGVGHAARVVERSAATTFPVASEAFYKDQPAQACAHPAARLYAWFAHDGAPCVCCSDCGAVLTGAAVSVDA